MVELVKYPIIQELGEGGRKIFRVCCFRQSSESGSFGFSERSVSESKAESDTGRHLWPPYAHTNDEAALTHLDDCCRQQ